MPDIQIKPRKGFRVRDPLLKDFLPEDGRKVTDSDYWRRRIRDKDVTLIEQPKVKPAEKKEP